MAQLPERDDGGDYDRVGLRMFVAEAVISAKPEMRIDSVLRNCDRIFDWIMRPEVTDKRAQVLKLVRTENR